MGSEGWARTTNQHIGQGYGAAARGEQSTSGWGAREGMGGCGGDENPAETGGAEQDDDDSVCATGEASQSWACGAAQRRHRRGGDEGDEARKEAASRGEQRCRAKERAMGGIRDRRDVGCGRTVMGARRGVGVGAMGRGGGRRS
jgi:hypothetical protein